MTRIARKPGLFDSRIASQKSAAVSATYRNGALKGAIMKACYGGRKDVPASILSRLDVPRACNGAQLFTDRGDFSHLSGAGVHCHA